MGLLQAAIWFDQGLNVLLGGYADETLSARAHRMRVKGHKYWGRSANAIDRVFFWQKDHCLNSYLSEKQRKHFPEAYKTGEAT